MIKKLSIIIPCYNESKNLDKLVRDFIPFTSEFDFELILVNNGSTDDSSIILGALRLDHSFLKVVTIKKNIGYGHGIMTGLKAAKTDVLAYTHADMQTPIEDIFKAYQSYLEHSNKQILIKGNRIKRANEDSILTKGLAWIVSFVLGYKIEDINGQPKVFSKEFLNYCKYAPVDFSFDVFILYKARLNQVDIKTLDVIFKDRLHGESKWANNRWSKYKTIYKYLKSIHNMAIQNFYAPNNLYREIYRFLIVGIVNVAIFYSLYMFILSLKMYYLIAATIGFVVSFFFGFILNRFWTFFANKGSQTKQGLKYFILSILMVCLNLILILFFTEWLHVSNKLSPLFSIVICSMLSFQISKQWVFK